VASPGLSLVLDLESAPRQTRSTGGPPRDSRFDPADEPRQASVGHAPHLARQNAAQRHHVRNSYCPTVPCSPTWGEERIANELKLKLATRVSPRTVGKYLHRERPVRTPDPKQRWLTLVRNHAKVMVACDFVVITAALRTLCVFLVMEIGSRRILHYNVTAHPTAEWTLQQFREVLPGNHPNRFLIHDRDRIFAEEVDIGLANLGVRVLRTPGRAPKANAVCASDWAGAFVARVSTC